MGNNKCSHDECQLDVYQDGKCVLHCKKNINDKDSYLNFDEVIIEYIRSQIIEKKLEFFAHTYTEDIIEILNDTYDEIENHTYSRDDNYSLRPKIDFPNKPKTSYKEDVLQNIQSIKIDFLFIHFPPIDFEASKFCEYEKILQKLGIISFISCEFYNRSLKLEDTKCCFSNCIFHNSWSLSDYKALENKYGNLSCNKDVIYKECVFKEKISSPIKSNKKAILGEKQFCNCSFKCIEFIDILFKKQIFCNDNNNSFKYIDSLTIDDCTIKGKFILNNLDFLSLKIQNSNFKALVDCYQTRFKNFHIEKSIFEKFTGFEKCKFGEVKEPTPKLKKKQNKAQKITAFENDNSYEENYFFKGASFHYATFLDFVNFRDTEFHNGLDLRNANFKEAPNFLDVKVESNNKIKKTNRETFRIIKHSFDKVGNTIEANKYFAYEMKKEREAISIKEDFNKKTMLNLNYWISDFGQSWVKPFIWILGIALLHYFIVKGTFQCISPSNFIYEPLKLLGDFFDDLANSIIPFRKFIKLDKEGMEFINLIFLIVYSTLIYNLVIAVKRITKR